MSSLPRARVFVLRDKQRELHAVVKNIYRKYEKEMDEDDDQVLVQLTRELNRTFGIELMKDDVAKNSLSSLEIAGLVAFAVLDKDPPNTKPPWHAPWNEHRP